MKLLDIPRGSKIRLPIGGVDESGQVTEKVEMCTFHHIDGMYSYISTPSGGVVHLGAMVELTLGEDGVYEIAE